MAFGHSKGHCDGLALRVIEAPKTEHVLEFKTMSEKYFKKTKEVGVEEAKPVYYAQAQIYMFKMNKTRALFCAVNKNNDDYYFERLKLDKGMAKDLERRAESIVLSEKPPKKLNEKPTWWQCKFCDAIEVCHFGKEPLISCRTCANINILKDGEWECGNRNLKLATAQQRLACERYVLTPI